jgi:hypothetical protein
MKIPKGSALVGGGALKTEFWPPEDGKLAKLANSGAQPGVSTSDDEDIPSLVSARAKEIFMHLKKANEANENEQVDMIRRNTEEALKEITSLHKRRLALGEILFVQRALFKSFGRRDFTDWIQFTLHLAIRTAYDYINEWEDTNMVSRGETDESAGPRPEVDAMVNGPAVDESRTAQPARPAEMRTRSPERHFETVRLYGMTDEECELFREYREGHKDRFDKMFHETALQVVDLAQREDTDEEGRAVAASSASPAPQAEPAQPTA